MKSIIVAISNAGHSMRNLMPEYWEQIQKINGGKLEEKNDAFIIHLTNGTKLNVSNKISKQDEHRFYYEGSLKPILDKPFWFIKNKDSDFYELWDYYFLPGQGGFSMLCTLE